MTLKRDIVNADPVTGTSVVGVERSDVVGVVLPATGGKIQSFGKRYREDLVKGEMHWAITSAGAFEPEPGDRLVVGEREYEIAGNTPINPDTTTTVINQMGVKLL